MTRFITFCSGNAGKISEVNAILSSHFEIKHVDIDLNEYQGTPEYIAERKCKDAASILKGPVLVEDTSLCYNAYKGMPGPYVKWFLKAVGPSGLHKMLDGFEDKTAEALCVFAYTEGENKDVTIFKGVCPGSIVEPRGPTHFGWDPIFQPQGFKETYAEMDKELKNKISHRGRALQLLKDHFLGPQ